MFDEPHSPFFVSARVNDKVDAIRIRRALNSGQNHIVSPVTHIRVPMRGTVARVAPTTFTQEDDQMSLFQQVSRFRQGDLYAIEIGLIFTHTYDYRITRGSSDGHAS